MTKDEYLNMVESKNASHIRELSELARQFALSNNPYKVGDRIKDQFQYGEIVKINWTKFGNLPQCIYQCHALNKDGSKKKNKRELLIDIYQQNIPNHDPHNSNNTKKRKRGFGKGCE